MASEGQGKYHLRLLADEIRKDLGTDVSRVVTILESNEIENTDNQEEITIMTSFLDMTCKYVNTLEDTRRNFLMSICLLIPTGVCFFLSLLPTPVKPFAHAGLEILKPMIRLSAKAPPNTDTIMREKIEIDETDIKVACLTARYKRALDYTEVLHSRSDITDEDVKEMINLVGIYFGTEEMATLRYLVEKNSRKMCYIQSKKATYYLVLYVRVYFLYVSLQISMLSIAHSAHERIHQNMNTLSSSFIHLRDCFQKEKQRVEEFLKTFLAPCHQNATFLALLKISKYPEVKEYLLQIGVCLRLPVRNVNRKIALELQRTSRSREWMNMANNPVGTIWKTCTAPEGNRVSFKLEPVPEEENWFYLISAQWGSWYVYVKDNAYLRGKSSRPGDEGKFKFVEIENSRYMISVKSWPGKFIYMEDSLLQKIKISKSERSFDENFWWSIQIQEDDDEE